MSEWAGLMNQSVTIEGFHSYTPAGSTDPSYNAAATVKAKIDLRIKRVTTFDNQEAVSTCLICLPTTVSPDLYGRDRITLPAAYGSKQPVILAIEDAVDPDTGINDHWEVST